jgi:hypothetical protein
MVGEISIGAVLSEVNQTGAVFSVEYRKMNGDFGSKSRCTGRIDSANQLNDKRKRNRTGVLKLHNLDTATDFELYIDLLQSFNGQDIEFLV